MSKGSSNNRPLNQVLKKNQLNSGRSRGTMNSTTLRQDGNGSNPGRFIVKKAMSPTNENFSMNHHNLNI